MATLMPIEATGQAEVRSGWRAKPRILYIVTRADRGGAQTHLLDLAIGMRPNFDTQVAAGEAGFLQEACGKAGIPFHLLPHLRRTQNVFGEFIAFWEIRELFRRLNPDIVHAHTFKAGFLGRLAALSLGIPSVYTIHAWLWGTDEVSRLASTLGRPFERLAACWCERIITVSKAGARLVQLHKIAPASKVVTIRNGIADSTERATIRRTNSPVITMVARFTPAKDHELLLRAFAELPSGARLRLVGQGETRPNAENLAVTLGIRERVEFLGERSDIAGLLAESDAFVLASKTEMFPISILEAMRAGLPVVASDVGGVSEAVIDGQTGLLVPSGSVDALRDALIRVTQDFELRVELGREARKYFVDHFLRAVMEDGCKQVYEEILGRQQRMEVPSKSGRVVLMIPPGAKNRN